MKEAQELWLELPTTNPEAMQGEMLQLVSKYGLAPQPPLQGPDAGGNENA